MEDRFFEIFEQDNPLDVKYIKGQKPISEGLIKIYPINNTVEYVRRLFGLRDNQINVISEGNIHKILVMYGNSKERRKQMAKAMNLCGYELTSENTENVNNVVHQMYSQKFSNSLTNELKKRMTSLIYITPICNKDKIFQKGFVPKSKNELFSYGDSILFFTQDAPIAHIVDQVYQKDCLVKNKTNKHYYTLFQIALGKIPNEVNFEIDSNLNYAVKTKNNIRPITITNTIDFDVVEKYNQLIKNFFE